MTPVQIKALDFVRDRIAATGVSPTYLEIADAISAGSKSYAFRVVEQLIDYGALRRGPAGARRSLSLTEPSIFTVPTPALLAELQRRGVRLG